MMFPKQQEDLNIAIIGLGYVGLPLAVEFAKHRPVVAYDVNPKRVDEIKEGIDRTCEVSREELVLAAGLQPTNNIDCLRSCNCFIVAVPTPIDDAKCPDLQYLHSASRIVGNLLKPGDIVIFESTVYPGCTEEECVPLLEEYSRLNFNKDFFCGYSPERINPGDKEHRLSDIVKVTSGSTPEAACLIDELYKSIVTAGTHLVGSIKIAEAAKIIENTQRDLNIALVNELAIIFKKMDIDSTAVIDAASTKWNFLPFRPGLVGGHCIGVDPYYLIHQSRKFGHESGILQIGRHINDQMPAYVISQLKSAMEARGISHKAARVLLMGVAFKENCPDLRNSKVVDIYYQLVDIGCEVDIYDPVVDEALAQKNYGISLISRPAKGTYEALLLCVPHNEFLNIGADRIKELCVPNGIFYDVRSVFSIEESDLRL